MSRIVYSIQPTLITNKCLNHLQTEIATSSQLFENFWDDIRSLVWTDNDMWFTYWFKTSCRLPHFFRRRLYHNNPTRQLWLVQLSFWCCFLCHLAGETWLKQIDLILVRNAKKKAAGVTTHPEINNLAPAKPWWLEDYSFPFGARRLFSGVKC